MDGISCFEPILFNFVDDQSERYSSNAFMMISETLDLNEKFENVKYELSREALQTHEITMISLTNANRPGRVVS